MKDFSFLKVAMTAPGRLSKEEELQLVKDYQAGDPTAYSKLRISFRDLIEQAIANAIPSGNSVSASNLRLRADRHLPQILASYDVERGVKLNTYITSQLSMLLRNAVRENMVGPYVPRNQHDDLNRFRTAFREAEMEYGRNPGDHQIKQFYPADATTTFDKIKQYHVNSLMSDAVYGSEEDEEALTFRDQFDVGDMVTENDLFAGMEEEEQQNRMTQLFTPQEQQVINLVNNEGQSFVQIALSLGISTADVRKIMRRWHDETQI